MKLVTYNIQYSKGKDGRFDLERIANAVKEADIICLQEVVRNVDQVPDQDQPERLGELLGEHYWVYGPCADLDASIRNDDGTVQNRRSQFGNMVLSRWPILSSRLILLPKVRTYDAGSAQRGALEAIVDTPSGPLRVYSLHLDHLSSRQRVAEIRYLLPRLFAVPAEGASFTGPAWWGPDQPTELTDFVVMGDFNLSPTMAEYAEVVGEPDYYYGSTLAGDRLADSWTLAGNPMDEGITWYDDADNFTSGLRLDYGFVSPGMASRVSAAWIDDRADGSDHQPTWFELSP